MSAFFVPLGDGRYQATERTSGPWDPRHQHAGPPSALLTGALEQTSPREGMALARITVEILGAVPITELEVADERRAPGPLGRAARRRGPRGRPARAARARLARARLARRHAVRAARRHARGGATAAADPRRDVRLRPRRRVALGARRLGGPRARDGLDAHEGPGRRGRGADAAPARDGRRRLRQRRVQRARLGPLPVHQHRAHRALPARAGGGVGAARRADADRRGRRRAGESVLSDRTGPVARGAQALFVAPR